MDTTTDTWIEITDASNSTTFPRQKLNSVPYAMKAGFVDNSATTATSSNTSESIVLRDTSGNFEVSEPTSASHAATKSYVDNQVSASQAATTIYVDNQVAASQSTTITYVDNKVATSETNTKAYVDSQLGSTMPAGAVIAFNLSSCPSGWLAADGSGGRPDLRECS